MTSKVLFFDIDGTLWKREEGICEDTLLALQKAKENGHKIFLNSGRSQAHIIDEKLLSAGWDGFVTGCGTYIKIGDRIVRNNKIAPEELERVINLCHEYKVRIILEGNHDLYFDNEEFDGDPYGEILKRELHGKHLTIKDNWGKWVAGKFSVDLDDLDLGKKWLDIIAEDYKLIKHTENIYEVVPYGYNKATGMKEAMEAMGLTLSDAIAFGDGANDAEMLRFAGTAVAMEEAPRGIKAIADYVTAGPSNGGIYRALKHLGLI